jgi:hypothetical protein
LSQLRSSFADRFFLHFGRASMLSSLPQSFAQFTRLQVPLNVIRSLVSRLEQSATFPATWLAR